MRQFLGMLVGCAVLGCAATPASARRPDAPRRRALQRLGVVLLLERKDPQAATSLVQAIRSQLADTAIRLDLQTVDRFAGSLSRQLAMARKTATSKRANVVIWFSLTRAEPLYLYFVEKQGIRLIMRSFGDMAPDDRAEAAAIVVRSSVVAFLRGQRLGKKITDPAPRARPRPPPARPPVLPGRPPPRRIWTSLELGYGYAYDDWDASLTGQHGLEARVALHLRPRWSVLAGYQWTQLPILRDATDKAEVQLRLHRILLGARFRHPFGRWQVGATLGVNADYVAYTVRQNDLVVVQDERPLFLWSITASLHVGVRLAQRIRLQLDLGAEVGLYNPTLRLQNPDEPSGYSKFGKSEVIRPRLLLALAVDLI